ncbi:MAG: potassium transporter, partial [Candidatus Rokubacteria bacterium]|nr:potassium transporter [Candidatus Rokubacteria bacterium]
VTESSYACGRSLAELDLRRASGATPLALVRDGTTLSSPGAEVTVQAGDTLVLLGTNVQVERALALLDTGTPPPAG